MKIAIMLAAAAVLGASATYAADAPPDVMKSKGCLNCHAADTKKVGPAFKDVAAKHKDNKNAVEDLTAKLKSGKGHPKVSATDEELKTALTWVMNLK